MQRDGLELRAHGRGHPAALDGRLDLTDGSGEHRRDVAVVTDACLLRGVVRRAPVWRWPVRATDSSSGMPVTLAAGCVSPGPRTGRRTLRAKVAMLGAGRRTPPVTRRSEPRRASREPRSRRSVVTTARRTYSSDDQLGSRHRCREHVNADDVTPFPVRCRFDLLAGWAALREGRVLRATSSSGLVDAGDDAEGAAPRGGDAVAAQSDSGSRSQLPSGPGAETG